MSHECLHICWQCRANELEERLKDKQNANVQIIEMNRELKQRLEDTEEGLRRSKVPFEVTNLKSRIISLEAQLAVAEKDSEQRGVELREAKRSGDDLAWAVKQVRADLKGTIEGQGGKLVGLRLALEHTSRELVTRTDERDRAQEFLRNTEGALCDSEKTCADLRKEIFHLKEAVPPPAPIIEKLPHGWLWFNTAALSSKAHIRKPGRKLLLCGLDHHGPKGPLKEMTVDPPGYERCISCWNIAQEEMNLCAH